MMDQHFSKKLRDLEITPSERANELFRSRLEQLSPQKEEKRPGKYFATAAAVLVALGFLFYLHLNENVMKADSTAVLPKTTDEIITGQETATAPAETGIQQEQEEEVRETPPSAVSSSPAPVRVPAAKPSPGLAEEQNAPRPAKKLLSDLQSLNPEISYRYHNPDLTDFAILDTHSPLDLEIPETSSFAEAPEKPTPLLVKVVREVKYVANGDRPDLDRAGIKPAATTLAHNQNGLLANESRQIKEGFHKFKEIFR